MSIEIAKERIAKAKLQRSKFLDLSKLGLDSLPPELSELTELTYLFLDQNKLTDIRVLKPLNKLKLLSLGNNRLKEMPLFLTELKVPINLENQISGQRLVKLFQLYYQALDRAVFISDHLCLALARGQDVVLAQAQARDLAGDLALDLALDQALDRAGDLAGALAGALNRALDRDLDRALDRAGTLYRALYRALDRAEDRDRDLDRDLDRAEDRDLDRDRARALDRDRDRTLDRDRDLDRVLDRDRDLDRVLGRALDLALDLDLDLDLDRDRARALDRALARALDLLRALDLDRDRALAQALDLLRALDLDRDRALDQALALTLALDRTGAQALDRARDRDRDRAGDINRALDRALTRDRYPDFHSIQSVLILLFLKIHHNQKTNETLLSLFLVLIRSMKNAHYSALIFHQSFATGDIGIYLNGNPISSPPPPEVIHQGNTAIKSFLTDFVEKEVLNEVKVILVGEGAAGKTSLVNRILEKPFSKKESQTHGIKISKHKVKHKHEDFLVNFWDFGGQEIMHNTHRFFLTKRCVYMLVLDSRKDEKAEYWLNYAHSFGGGAPVIVVLNKIDENPSFEVNRLFLSEKYENIKSYHRVSCLNNEGVSELKKSLLDELWTLELRKTAFPKGWFKVKQRLEEMTRDFINYSDYKAICGKNHVNTPQSQKVLLELLNDLGVVLNYDKLRIYDTQVLNPLWLTNAVYRIINSPVVAKKKGRFNIYELEAIINDKRYQKENPRHWINVSRYLKPSAKPMEFPEEKFLFIVGMMREFELLYQIEENEYLVPALLPDEQKLYTYNADDKVISFVIEYVDFLPPAIIPRLIVKLNKYVYKDQVWKTGMVLQEKSIFRSVANIVLDKESKKINIEVKGARHRDFLTMIRETIKEINKTYQNIEVTEWVPLPATYKGETVLVDYIDLEGHEVMKREEYYSGRLRKSFKVKDLLNGVEKPEMRKEFNKVHIFISYSHKDEDFMYRMVDHLMPLIRLNQASIWYDKSIEGGEEWLFEIESNLEKADIVLCLISSSFVSSNFCYEKELNQALKAHDQGTKAVIPIRIKETHWEKLPIAQLQGFPSQWMQDIDDHKSWTEIAKGVDKVINRMKKI